MEDVVLHYQSGSAAGLGSLLERTEKLLESFPCRTPPVFTSWFPSAADRHLPIRPAKPAPIITCWGDVLVSESRPHSHTAQDKPEAERSHERAETSRSSRENPQKPKDDVSETPKCLVPAPEREIATPPPETHKDGVSVKRSWSVFTQKHILLQSSPSKRFHHMVSTHRLHLRQRAKWVINQHNCGAAGDIEQVWRAVSRSIQSSRLPTCNANIQRERAEIWVFCDVVQAEQVGRLLKDELQLLGRISLSVHRQGNIFSM